MSAVNRDAPGRRQQGAALLVTLLLLLVGSGALLARSSARLGERNENPDRTLTSMMGAKEALISFAVSRTSNWPDPLFPGDKPVRPGELPCPDLNRDGASVAVPEYAGDECVAGGPAGAPAAYLGWFPYRRLRVDETTDGGGARLWFALSPAYANAGRDRPALNSRVNGQLTLDGQADIVALIIAPGSAVADQVRPSAAAGFNADTHVREYLEGENADGDLAFASTAAGAFNDRVLAITRSELMGRVEKRVLREVNTTLREYYRAQTLDASVSDANLPWLKAYEDPQAATSFRHGPGPRSEGLLALHTRPDVFLDPQGNPVEGESRLENGFEITWQGLDGSTLTESKDPVEDLTSIQRAKVLAGPVTVNVSSGKGYCQWIVGRADERRRANCRVDAGETVEQSPHPRQGQLIDAGDPQTRIKAGSTRSYFFDMDIQRGLGPIVTWPSAGAVERRRRLQMDPLSGANELRIVIIDNVIIEGPTPAPGDDRTVASSVEIVWNSSDTDAVVHVSNIPYRLDPVHELPGWFEPNEWQRLVYVVLSPALQVGGSGECGSSGDCVTLRAGGMDVATDLVAASLLMGASVAVPAGVPGDYLEGRNATTGDLTVERAASSSIPFFDDQLDLMRSAGGAIPMAVLP